jgi:hypothetical protein
VKGKRDNHARSDPGKKEDKTAAAKAAPKGPPQGEGGQGSLPGKGDKNTGSSGGQGSLPGKGEKGIGAPGSRGTEIVGVGGKASLPQGGGQVNTLSGAGGSLTKPSAELLSKFFKGQHGPLSGMKAGGKDPKQPAKESPVSGGPKPERGKVEDITDPVERAAVLRLRQAVRQIQANREMNRSGSRAGDGARPPVTRDW